MTIYSLVDPGNGEIRYVGKSQHPQQRLYFHLHASASEITHCYRWIDRLKRQGLRPTMIILEDNPIDGDSAAEIRWIAQLRNAGCDLTNTADGGNGGATITGRNLTPEWKANIGAANLGRVRSPELRAYWSEQRKGRKPWNRGRKETRPEVLAKLSASHKGRSWSQARRNACKRVIHD
jgi:hypothetical protein